MRTVGIVTITALALAACGDDSSDANDSADAQDAAPVSSVAGTTDAGTVAGDTTRTGVRTVDTIWGDIEIPEQPERVVAIDEYSAVNLLAMGVMPIVAFSPYGATIVGSIAADAGVEVVPATYGEWNLELIASYEPDVITMVGGPETEPFYATLSEIAPTVVVPHVAPWREILDDVGELTGQEERADRLEAALDSEIAALAGSTEPGTSLSVLASGAAFGTFTIGSDAAMSEVLDEVGYARPTIEQQPATTGVLLPTSDEVLDEHDADLIVALSGNDAFYSIDTLTSLPTWPTLSAVVDGAVHETSGEMWTASDPFAVSWVLADLAAIADGTPAGSTASTGDRWTAYLDALDG